MGGFIKISLKEDNKITTDVIGTSDLNFHFSDPKIVFEDEICAKLIKKLKLKDDYMFEKDALKRELKSPFNYGYIFIDRDEKNVFYINNYNSFDSYTNYSFHKIEQLMKQDFKVKINSFVSDENESYFKETTYDLKNIDLNNLRNLSHFYNYIKIYNSIPYLKRMTVNDIEIDFNNFDEIFNIIKKTQDTVDSFNINLTFNDWNIMDYNLNEKSLLKLFNYLKDRNLLNNEELLDWEAVLKEERDLER